MTSELIGQRALVTGATSASARPSPSRSDARAPRSGPRPRRRPRRRDRRARSRRRRHPTFVAADLGDADDVRRLAEEAGDVDILVNNAGISVWAPPATSTSTPTTTMFDCNVRAPFILVAGLAPGMAERGNGAIVSV